MTQKQPFKKLIIFDCDGVLVDSEIIASRIDAEIFTKCGYPISIEESIKKFTGINLKTTQEMISQESGIVLQKEVLETMPQILISAFEKELKPLMKDLLERGILKNLPKCVASSAARDHVLKSLEITDQIRFFEDKNIFTSAQVKEAKPAPDLFLFAASQMGFSPQECLVIEDSIVGIQAARSANMKVIGFLGGSHAKFDWYEEKIKEQEIPIAYTTSELYNFVIEFLKD